MSYKNNRNSREDKSLKHKRFEGGSKNEQPDSFNSEKKKLFGEGQDKPFRSRPSSSDSGKRSGDKSFEKREGRRSEGGEGKSRSGGSSFGKKRFEGGRSSEGGFEKKSFGDKKFGDKKFGDKKFGDKKFGDKKFGDRDKKFGDTERKFGDRDKKFGDSERKFGDRDKKFGDRKPFEERKSGEKRPRSTGERKSFDRNEGREWTHEERLAPTTRARQNGPSSKEPDLIRLNRYIANAGICSRRKADELIEAGVVSVNGEVVSELGFKVNPAKDVIRYNGETLKREKMVYVLLNKPKDYITTTDDPQERRTVMQLVDKASRERIYPVGRLDRNTTGLLLMTNDGDLAEKLSHPRNNITKIYHVELSKSLSQGDFNKIEFGLELEDGLIKPDNVSYVQGASKREIGIQIHSGKNRIVRRIFEHLGYEVVKLDRVVYANLTKKDLPRGRWRYLDEKEIVQLKHFIK
ncbi:pseudouridine synthase [Desertivirga arenae]|uniref:pseudouridine synthase n=1 Tax=Desertivirga arenae TaxID=2810309 RepID=UPI001A957340|nr:pseudouridine synthase [Pedobacter sp. SYSU D00823]